MSSLRFSETYSTLWCRCQETRVEKGTWGQYQGALDAIQLLFFISACKWTGPVALTSQKKVRLCAAILLIPFALHTHTHVMKKYHEPSTYRTKTGWTKYRTLLSVQNLCFAIVPMLSPEGLGHKTAVVHSADPLHLHPMELRQLGAGSWKILTTIIGRILEIPVWSMSCHQPCPTLWLGITSCRLFFILIFSLLHWHRLTQADTLCLQARLDSAKWVSWSWSGLLEISSLGFTWEGNLKVW